MTTPLKSFASYLYSIYLVFLLTMTHIPVANVPDVDTSDKLLHFGAYAVLAILAGFWLWAVEAWSLRTAWIVIFALILVGALDELTQSLVGRSTEWMDWLADIAGILSGFGLWALIVQIALPRRPTEQ